MMHTLRNNIKLISHYLKFTNGDENPLIVRSNPLTLHDHMISEINSPPVSDLEISPSENYLPEETLVVT